MKQKKVHELRSINRNGLAKSAVRNSVFALLGASAALISAANMSSVAQAQQNFSTVPLLPDMNSYTGLSSSNSHAVTVVENGVVTTYGGNSGAGYGSLQAAPTNNTLVTSGHVPYSATNQFTTVQPYQVAPQASPSTTLAQAPQRNQNLGGFLQNWLFGGQTNAAETAPVATHIPSTTPSAGQIQSAEAQLASDPRLATQSAVNVPSLRAVPSSNGRCFPSEVLVAKTPKDLASLRAGLSPKNKLQRHTMIPIDCNDDFAAQQTIFLNYSGMSIVENGAQKHIFTPVMSPAYGDQLRITNNSTIMTERRTRDGRVIVTETPALTRAGSQQATQEGSDWVPVYSVDLVSGTVSKQPELTPRSNILGVLGE